MATPIYKAVDALPASSVTVRMMQALDWVVPGEYKNLVGFDNTIRAITGHTDEALIQKVGARAIQLYNDPSQGYQRALWLYQTADYLQGVSGFAATINKLGETFSFLSFLGSISPKSDTTQAFDLGMKLVVEVVSFCQLNGLPGDSIGDFVKSLSDYRHEAIMRMATLICVDGIIPLGPDFMEKTLSLLDRTGVTGLDGNSRFEKIKEYLPGKGTAEKLSYMQEGLSSVKDWTKGFVAEKKITSEGIVGSLRKYMNGVEGHLDYLGAFLDMTVNYYEHTGTQTVARSLISRAAAEI